MQSVLDLVLPSLALVLSLAASVARGDDACNRVFGEHLERLNAHPPVPYKDSKQVLFLHVPRTAGSSMQACLLNPITPPKRRCKNVYTYLDKLEDVVQSNLDCDIFVSHVDTSALSLFPASTMALMTQLRDPVERIISSYEFSVMSSGMIRDFKQLHERNDTEVSDFGVVREQQAEKARQRNSVLSDRVWPWDSLLPFFAEDIAGKRAELEAEFAAEVEKNPSGSWVEVSRGNETYFHNKALNSSEWELSDEQKQNLLPSDLDPYDNRLYMSLREFVRSKEAHELLHNGQAYQILGISNISVWKESSRTMRKCVANDTAFGRSVLELTRHMLASFMHVGDNSRTETSTEAAAAAFGWSLSKPAYTFNRTAHVGSADSEDGGLRLSDSPLGVDYQRCSMRYAGTGEHMRFTSFPDGRRTRFGKEARKAIPQDVIDYIKEQNWLDEGLYVEAQAVLTKQQELNNKAGLLERLPDKESIIKSDHEQEQEYMRQEWIQFHDWQWRKGLKVEGEPADAEQQRFEEWREHNKKNWEEFLKWQVEEGLKVEGEDADAEKKRWDLWYKRKESDWHQWTNFQAWQEKEGLKVVGEPQEVELQRFEDWKQRTHENWHAFQEWQRSEGFKEEGEVEWVAGEGEEQRWVEWLKLMDERRLFQEWQLKEGLKEEGEEEEVEQQRFKEWLQREAEWRQFQEWQHAEGLKEEGEAEEVEHQRWYEWLQKRDEEWWEFLEWQQSQGLKEEGEAEGAEQERWKEWLQRKEALGGQGSQQEGQEEEVKAEL